MDQLKRLRMEKGLSQAKLAALADVDPSTVNQIERGARDASPATLRKLAEALDVSIAELLEDAAPKVGRSLLLEPSLLNGLEEERRVEWQNAVENARRLRQTGPGQLEELLSAWRESKERGEAADARRGLGAKMGRLLQETYDARSALLANLEYGMAIPDPRLAAAQPGESFPVPAWEEVRETDRSYWALREMVERAGLYIRTESAQEAEAAQAGQPGAHRIEERAA